MTATTHSEASKQPATWASTTFGELFELSYGKSLTKKNRKSSGGQYPVYGSNGVVDYHSEYLVDGPVIIVGRKGAAGAVSFSEENCWPIDTTYFVKPSPELHVRFCYYLIKSLRLEQFEKSTAIPGLSRDDVSDLILIIPPLKEQGRIVAKIEELFSELDNGIESLKTAREQLKVYRQAVLKCAFEGKLTAQWRATRSATHSTSSTLGKHLDLLTSGSRGWAKYYSPNGDVFIRAQNLKHDCLDLEDIAYVSLPQNSEGMRTRVRPGDVLITITGANVTKTGYVKTDIGTAYVSQHVALARPASTILPEFLYWFLIAEAAGRKQLSASAYGAGKPGLNLENIRSVKIDLPSLDEQLETVSRINSMLSIEETVSAQLDHEIALCDTLRRSILKKAFSGQLVVQDPHDEQAPVLLERIKAEKAQKENGKKKSKRKTAA